ncbi:DUF4258 domain-containing protein [Geobacter benzoatilyticus]|jgi:hypothetical protein|uniref:DUF4258 domain-containing protein n=1 Tax=Geobacter benzoatilyticus TaxID=2815309 RepID=A0ABX7Q7F8_9BACT|nr:DUF4258 domain-containing protein [Geobacter benzoatilyticus]QSV46771.1 DUF4258 domain-containing protein [Geobacter benzoatilyticus]
MVEPLKPSEARKLIQHILKDGYVTYSRPHAIDRMKEREMDTSDCINILRGGKVSEGEYENGSWRYRVETPKMAVVVTFVAEDELMIVTAWREKR